MSQIGKSGEHNSAAANATEPIVNSLLHTGIQFQVKELYKSLVFSYHFAGIPNYNISA